MGVLSMVRMKTRETGSPEPGASRLLDAELIRACQAGNADAFGELVQRYQGRAYWVAYGLVNNEDEARDITQDAFVRVYRALERFDFEQSFYTWLYRIVVNLAIDRIRKLSKSRTVNLDDVGEPTDESPADAAPGRPMEASETSRLVREVLDRLPDKYRTVMVLRELNGLSCKEIAGIVRSSHATVRWRLHMARKFFKDEWERRQRRTDRGESSHDL